ncbi:hypothetical protein Tco_0832123 [Tanacetum coccineum]
MINDDEPHITFLGSMKHDKEEDSDLASIPDDEIRSPSSSKTSETEEDDNQSQQKELFKSEERDADKVLDEIVDLKAFADKPSLSNFHDKLNTKKKLSKDLKKKLGVSIRKEVHKGMRTVKGKDMVHILESVSVFTKANAEGEKWEKANPDPSISKQNDRNPDSTQGEHLKKNDEKKDTKEAPPTTDQSF